MKFGFKWRHLRDGQEIASGFARNTVILEGLERLAFAAYGDYNENGAFDGPGEPDPHPLFMGLLSEEGFIDPTPTDTLADFPWTEFTSYNAGERPGATITPNYGDGSAIAFAEFTFNATGQVRGLFLVLGENAVAWNSDDGFLWSAAGFSEGVPISVRNGDTLFAGYTTQGVPVV